MCARSARHICSRVPPCPPCLQSRSAAREKRFARSIGTMDLHYICRCETKRGAELIFPHPSDTCSEVSAGHCHSVTTLFSGWPAWPVAGWRRARGRGYIWRFMPRGSVDVSAGVVLGGREDLGPRDRTGNARSLPTTAGTTVAANDRARPPVGRRRGRRGTAPGGWSMTMAVASGSTW